MGRKESNQTNYLTYLPIYSKKIFEENIRTSVSHRIGGNRNYLSYRRTYIKIKLKTEFSIAIFRPTGDKWQSKTLFLTIFDLRSSIVKSVFDCHLSGAILVTNDFEKLRTGYPIIPGVRYSLGL